VGTLALWAKLNVAINQDNIFLAQQVFGAVAGDYPQ